MDILIILLIALGLSIDSFVVSVANGLTIKNISLLDKLIISFSLSVFQALMPLIGWYAGIGISEYIKNFDHWIAFILLVFIGLKMIYESFSKNEHKENNKLKITTLIAQSIATSIDAFAVGISLALLNVGIAIPVIIIGIVTFFASILGLQLGKYIGIRFGKYIEIFGGLVLIGIGVKILIEHIYF
ncbi:MAG: hypothetical protein DRI84_02400 [Bacteroidetes bacterium]|nr:MAG: hypothetical protein DRI84_02400 [Bacteroidota bacterium]